MTFAQTTDVEGAQGAVWGTESEDLDATLVRWRSGTGVAAHRNDEVDVIMIVLEGEGQVRVDGDSQHVKAGSVVLIDKGCEREIRATEGTLSYINVHKRRRKMMPNMVRPKP